MEKISEVYKRNNNGLKTLPCSTPDTTLTSLLQQPSTITCCTPLEYCRVSPAIRETTQTKNPPKHYTKTRGYNISSSFKEIPVLDFVIFCIFALIFIDNCYGVWYNVWKFQDFMMKVEPLACIWSSCVISIMMTQHFHKLNIKLINLCEIGLFHIVWEDLWCFYRYPWKLSWDLVKIICWGQYIPIMKEVCGGGGYMVHFTFFLYHSQKWKN